MCHKSKYTINCRWLRRSADLRVYGLWQISRQHAFFVELPLRLSKAQFSEATYLFLYFLAIIWTVMNV